MNIKTRICGGMRDTGTSKNTDSLQVRGKKKSKDKKSYGSHRGA